MKNLVIILISFSMSATFPAFAQNADEKYTSAETLIETGIKLYDSGNYDEALFMFEQVNPNDKLYPLSVYEKALTLTALEKPDAALEALFSVKKYPGSLELLVSNLTGNNLDDVDKDEEALKIYSEKYSKYQHTFLLPYNYALTLYGEGKYDRAAEILDKSIRINPYHFNSLILSGVVNYAQGYLVPALLCFAYASSTASNDNARSRAYNLFESALTGKLIEMIETESKGKVSYEAASDEKNSQYAELDYLLRSKAAMGKQFKLKTKIDYPEVRQLQFLIENVNVVPGKKDIFNQLYIPYFNELVRNDHEDALICNFVAFSDNEDIRKQIAKNKSKTEKFQTWAESYIDNGQTKLFNPDEKKHYTFGGAGILSAGSYADAEMQVPTGNWIYYQRNGCMEAEGAFDNGLKQGLWKYYDSNGDLTKTFIFENDKENGEAIFYYGNGIISERSSFANGERAGITTGYNESGIRSRSIPFENGQLSGKYIGYFNNGNTAYEIDYANGTGNGKAIYYNPNKTIYFTGSYIDDLQDGTHTYYYENAQPSSISQYKDGVMNGVQKAYYPNGTLFKSYNTNSEGQIIGIYTEYYESGILSDSVQYSDNGKPIGQSYSFDKDGKLISVTEYDNGNIKSYIFYDKSGNVIAEDTEKGGNITVKSYDAKGRMRQNGLLINGKKEDVWKYFDPYGNLEKEILFKNDEPDGLTVTYYPFTGNVSEQFMVVEGQYDGKYIKYYKNGQPELTGYYVQGNKEGTWEFYYPNGNLQRKEYRKEDQLIGEQINYIYDGEKDYSEVYENNYLNKQTYYGDNDEVLSNCELNAGNGTLIHRFSTGQKIYECEMLGGKHNGTLKMYDIEGRLLYEGIFIEDLPEGVHVNFDIDGRKKSVNNFLSGKLNGVSELYFNNGKKKTTIEYVSNIPRKRTDYFGNGKISYEAFYDEEKLPDAPFSYYDETGALIHKLIFENGTVTGYAYSDKSGELILKDLSKNEEMIETYYPSGIKSSEMRFKNGIRVGNAKRWHSNGKLYQNYNYENDDYYGIQEEYSLQGVLISSKNYLYDEKHGLCKEFYENGILESEEEYVYGMLHGTCKYYHPNGKLRCTRIFRNDRLISEKKGE